MRSIGTADNVRNLVVWFIMGLCNNIGYVVFLSAAESIVSGEAGVVLACDIIPTVILKVTAPYWVHKVPYNVRYGLCTLFSFASFLLAGAFEVTWLRLLGVVCASVAAGWGEVTSLALMAFYKPNSITAWSSGTGFAGVGGAGFYLLLRTILGLSAQVTLFIGCVFPALFALTYFVFMGPPSSSSEDETLVDMSVPSEDEESSLLDDQPDTGVSLVPLRKRSNEGKPTPSSTVVAAAAKPDPHQMSLAEKASAIVAIWPTMASLFAVYCAEYVISSGVAGTLSFPLDRLDKHDFYVRAQFVYQTGVFLSRSSGTVWPIDRLWPMPVLQLCNLALFLLQACTQFIGSSWLVLCFVFVEGLLGGGVYVNAFRKLREQSDPWMREFNLGAASMADSIGIALASLIAIFLESALNSFRAAKGLPTA
jgi:battenin